MVFFFFFILFIYLFIYLLWWLYFFFFYLENTIFPRINFPKIRSDHFSWSLSVAECLSFQKIFGYNYDKSVFYQNFSHVQLGHVFILSFSTSFGFFFFPHKLRKMWRLRICRTGRYINSRRAKNARNQKPIPPLTSKTNNKIIQPKNRKRQKQKQKTLLPFFCSCDCRFYHC